MPSTKTKRFRKSLRSKTPVPPGVVRRKLDDFRAELAELAFRLEKRNRYDAADVVAAISGRIAEIAGSLSSEPANEVIG